MKKLLLMLLTAITVVACGSGDDDSTTPAPIPSLGGVGAGVQSQRLLTVEVGEQLLQEEGAAAPLFRRTAAATTTETLSAFTMHYEADWSQEFKKTVGEWNSVEWPILGDDKIDFYANNEGTYVYNSGNPYVSFTALEDAFNTKDFLVAEHKNIAYNDEGGKVSLHFRHACAAVQFQICATQTAAASHTFVVKSAILKSVCKQGDYYYADGWKGVSTTTNYTLTNSDIALTIGYQLLPCQWLFVVPQSKSGISLELKYTVDGGEEKTKNITLGTDAWAAGYRYTISIRVGTSFL